VVTVQISRCGELKVKEYPSLFVHAPHKNSAPVLTLPQLGLHYYVVLTVVTTWVLIWIGGLVTSKQAGMTVPDWPTSFGYNMFLFPISRWTGGIFYEHVHRLIASGVGLMTVGLTLFLLWGEKRRWLKMLGFVILGMVITQGIMGGLRVTLIHQGLGFLHGCFGQLFFCTLAAIAVYTSPWWERVARERHAAIAPWWSKAVIVTTILIFAQLAIGASMRHAHLGLSITDFPTAYGAWWPQITVDQLVSINERRVAEGLMPTTLTQIYLQMAHRVMAIVITIGVFASFIGLWAQRGINPWLHGWNGLWAFLVVVQVTLGIWTIWTGKAADIATAHVATGAVLLLTGVVQICLAHRLQQAEYGPQDRGTKPVITRLPLGVD
jgi:heme a synthase